MWRIDHGILAWNSEDGEREPLSLKAVYTIDAFTPLALLRRDTITVELSPHEVCLLIEIIERRAGKAARNPAMTDFSDLLLQRVAQLLELSR
jgi:hypothetical protein